MPTIVARPLETKAASGPALPESEVLFLAGSPSLTETDAQRIQEFLSASDNEMVTIIRSPMPTNEQIEKSTRNGKNTLRTDKDPNSETFGKEIGEDNSGRVVSRTQTYARAEEKLAFGDTEFDENSRFVVNFVVSQKMKLDPNAEEA